MTRTPAVRADGLAVGYEGRAVVDGIGFELGPGETLAVLGTNGSGKSTLVKTLVGLLPPVAGDRDGAGGRAGRVARPRRLPGPGGAVGLRAAAARGRRGGDGALPDRGLLGRMRAGDRRIVAESLGRMGAAHLAHAPLEDLSGGQRQRVHIAQALAWRADLIVLDEPTAGLDVAGRDLLSHALAAERARGAAVVMCTHDISDALEADRALLLSKRVVANGPPAEVLTREAVLETFGLVVAELPGGQELAMDPTHRHDGHGHAH